MPPVAAPADKRFRRAQVKPAGKHRSRVHHVWLVLRVAASLLVMGYAGWRSYALVANASVLQVSQVTVEGNQRLSSGEVLALVEGLRGQNILGLDLTEWQDRVMSSPWVKDASLRRELPSTVEVRITERTPMAIGRIGNALYLVDAGGTVVDEYGPAYADLNLPIIDGLAAPGKDAPAIDAARAALAARVLADVADRPALADKLSQIDVSDPHDAVVMLAGDPTLLRVGEEHFGDRLQQYLDLGDALRERVSVIDYVDLRFPERLYVRPAKGAAVAPAPAAVRR
jgi:cell division protein FtsQ